MELKMAVLFPLFLPRPSLRPPLDFLEGWLVLVGRKMAGNIFQGYQSGGECTRPFPWASSRERW